VRRSARKAAANRPSASAQLQASGFSFVPNAALDRRTGGGGVIGETQAFRDYVEVGCHWGRTRQQAYLSSLVNKFASESAHGLVPPEIDFQVCFSLI